MIKFLKRLFRRRRKFGWKPNKEDDRDLKYRTTRPCSPLNSSLEGWDEITNQKGTSSCVGHAVCGAVRIMENKSGHRYGHPSRLFSYWTARERTDRPPLVDDGAYIRSAFKALQKVGVCDEEDWPFKVSKVNKKPAGFSPWAHASPRKNGEYLLITGSGHWIVDRIKSAISDGYPVVFGTQIGASFMKGGNTIDRPGKDEKIYGGHALRIVGYRTRPDGSTQFRVSNSWGTRWGDGGRCWMTERYITWVKTRDFTIVRGWDRLRGAS